MLRSILSAPFLVFCFAGCFSEPPETASADGTSGTPTSSTGDGTAPSTDSTSVSTTASETTAGSSTSGDSSSADTGTSWSTSTGDSSSSTGDPAPLCGCPVESFEYCERFDRFDQNSEFPGWSSDPASLPAQQVDGICGPAFRGEIVGGENFAVIGRRLPDVIADKGTDVIRVHGLMYIREGCAENTRHRLLSNRVDFEVDDYRYSAEIALENGDLRLVQRTNTGGIVTDDVIGTAPVDEWVSFEVSLLAMQSKAAPEVRVRVATEMLSRPRPPVADTLLSFSVVPGPYSYEVPAMAGCAVDFDDISVELLPSPP